MVRKDVNCNGSLGGSSYLGTPGKRFRDEDQERWTRGQDSLGSEPWTPSASTSRG